MRRQWSARGGEEEREIEAEKDKDGQTDRDKQTDKDKRWSERETEVEREEGDRGRQQPQEGDKKRQTYERHTTVGNTEKQRHGDTEIRGKQADRGRERQRDMEKARQNERETDRDRLSDRATDGGMEKRTHRSQHAHINALRDSITHPLTVASTPDTLAAKEPFTACGMR